MYVLIGKHLRNQTALFYSFIVFKKAFDRVWYDGRWHILRGLEIEEWFIQVIQALYDHATNEGFWGKQQGVFFQIFLSALDNDAYFLQHDSN